MFVSTHYAGTDVRVSFEEESLGKKFLVPYLSISTQLPVKTIPNKYFGKMLKSRYNKLTRGGVLFLGIYN
jgi:hypothetical protein